MDDDELVFASDEITENVLPKQAKWRILVVDDEAEVHQVTRLVMNDFVFDGHGVQLEFASSAKEAKTILKADKYHEIAVAIIDVVMESAHAGLELVQWVRDELKNHTIRLILRTGQPGEAPEESVIRNYDINDYKNKTELTVLRLKTSLYATLRSYRDIRIIERHRSGLEKIIAATSQFIECDTLSEFASTILNQISVILNIESSQIVCCAVVKEHTQSQSDLMVLAANKGATQSIAVDNTLLTDTVDNRIAEALQRKENIEKEDYFVGYFTTKRGTESVLYVENETPLEAVQHHLLGVFTHNIAVAHENLKLRDVIKESQKELSYVIGEAVEMRSKETGSHVKRVAQISYLLAKKYGLPESEAELIKLASPLHDVGKVGIPDHILNKPGKHDVDEWKIMQTHPTIGYEMLIKSDNPILQLGAHISHEHHERWDGKGYPRGLSGKDIHVAGRITAVADVFDALGSARCYKGPWDEDEIVTYFKQEKGKRFEPKLVEILLDDLPSFFEIRRKFPDNPD
ncbi:DUF3369 domain-containing protein [Alteromonas sp. ASW11-130]|uniref:DUF3369 domain-containing protein n=1 Tax=Alteromonas sp. ASW11-130 TaxID=3015775 RepID=UPI0022429D3A|nr:DUF3369 domain-containing protein [Alteromonas sp. ASW11-130]MCW8091913.1 DUF3369 domain-containing protein [Alteromonas sp. ASW11-130]